MAEKPKDNSISESFEKVCYLLGFPAIFLDSMKELLTYVPFWKADETCKFFPTFVHQVHNTFFRINLNSFIKIL